MVSPASEAVLAGWRHSCSILTAGALGLFRRWSRPVALSVADQGLASGAHFGLSLLLARWLAPGEYGAFALAYALFLLATGLHTSLILEPMGVIGPARYRACLPAYLRQVLWIHVWLAAAIALLILAAAGVLAMLGNALAPTLVAAGLAAPWMLLFWLFRRACYLSARPEMAVRGSLAYALILAAGLFYMWWRGLITTGGVFFLMAGAGAVVSLAFRRYLGVGGEKKSGSAHGPALPEVIRHHWAYARWSLATTVLYWLSNSIYMPLVAVLAGLQSVAAYRASENLMLPMSQVLTALGLLLLPWLSGRASTLGHQYLRGAAPKMALLAAMAAGLYVLGVLACGGRLIHLVYGGDRYAGSLALVPYLGAAVVLRAIGDTGFGIAVRAAGRPEIGFWATGAAAMVTLTAGLGLVSRYGAQGAAMGAMASAAASCVVYAGAFARQSR